jgi:hypothetical protein
MQLPPLLAGAGLPPAPVAAAHAYLLPPGAPMPAYMAALNRQRDGEQEEDGVIEID